MTKVREAADHGDSDDQDDGDESRATDDDDEEMDAEYDEHGMSDWIEEEEAKLQE